jgi:hypothetical protein
MQPLITGRLIRDKSARPTPRDLLTHPWILGVMKREVNMAHWIRQIFVIDEYVKRCDRACCQLLHPIYAQFTYNGILFPGYRTLGGRCHTRMATRTCPNLLYTIVLRSKTQCAIDSTLRPLNFFFLAATPRLCSLCTFPRKFINIMPVTCTIQFVHNHGLERTTIPEALRYPCLPGLRLF